MTQVRVYLNDKSVRATVGNTAFQSTKFTGLRLKDLRATGKPAPSQYVPFAKVERFRTKLGLSVNVFMEALGYQCPPATWKWWRDHNQVPIRAFTAMTAVFTSEWKPHRQGRTNTPQIYYHFDKIPPMTVKIYPTTDTKRLVRALCNYRTDHPEMTFVWRTKSDCVIVWRIS